MTQPAPASGAHKIDLNIAPCRTEGDRGEKDFDNRGGAAGPPGPLIRSRVRARPRTRARGLPGTPRPRRRRTRSHPPAIGPKTDQQDSDHDRAGPGQSPELALRKHRRAETDPEQSGHEPSTPSTSLARPTGAGAAAERSGPGLSIAAALVCRYGGRIRVDGRKESGHTRGTVIWLTLRHRLPT